MKTIKRWWAGFLNSFDAIKKITWPEKDSVKTFFKVVLVVIIVLSICLGLIDKLISLIISFLYA